MTICYSSHRKLTQVLILLPSKSHPLWLCLFPHHVTISLATLSWLPVSYLNPGVKQPTVRLSNLKQLWLSQGHPSSVFAHWLYRTQPAGVKRLHKIETALLAAAFQEYRVRYWSTTPNCPVLALKKLFLSPHECLSGKLPVWLQMHLLRALLCMNGDAYLVSYLMQKENARPLPGYLFYWADLLSRLKCMFSSPTCWAVANTSVSSCKALHLMQHQVFSHCSVAGGCRINCVACWELSFTEASLGWCDMN